MILAALLAGAAVLAALGAWCQAGDRVHAEDRAFRRHVITTYRENP